MFVLSLTAQNKQVNIINETSGNTNFAVYQNTFYFAFIERISCFNYV